MTAASAETLALKALAYLANSGPAFERFLAGSGTDLTNLRENASDPMLLAAVMDFLLTDDDLLTEFCAGESLEPHTLRLARHALPGG